MHVTVPDWVRVPPAEVAVTWALARDLFAEANVPYFAGVVAAFAWVLEDEPTPFDVTWVRATPQLVLADDMRAVAITSGNPAPADADIRVEYAAGVAATLGWLRGAVRHGPIKLTRRSSAA